MTQSAGTVTLNDVDVCGWMRGLVAKRPWKKEVKHGTDQAQALLRDDVS